METRRIGDVQVSLVGLGCNNFGGRIDADQTQRVVDAALEAGITLFDTADVYGGEGASEELLGRALGSRRDHAVIATKFGMALDDQRQGAHPDHVRSACEASLRRLGVEHIDLYQLHRPDPEVPIEETLGALDELIATGKVREIGHSNLSATQADEAEAAARRTGTARFVCAQDHWSLLARDAEDGILQAARRHELAVLPFFPLASGLLTGKYTSGEEQDPGWRLNWLPEERRSTFIDDERVATVRELEAFARDAGHSLLELAMSWLACQRPVASVIAGATRPEQVHANARAAGWQLTGEELAEVDRLTGR
ncbi:MAG: aldo/keto reductase [Nitriliruptor sp.]|nr:MAG: aldo/keto reductase [Nitriliruptor sp.]